MLFFSNSVPMSYLSLWGAFLTYTSTDMNCIGENKINDDFGSTEKMKETFINAGIGQFGSGWCWLVLNNGKLEITKTPNAENPIV